MGLLSVNAICRLASCTAISLSSTTAGQTLYTVPATKEGGVAVSGCIVTHFIHSAVSTNPSSAVWAFGFNSTAWDNVVTAAANATALTTATLFRVVESKAGAQIGAPGDVLKCMVSVGQGATTTETMRVDPFGFLY